MQRNNKRSFVTAQDIAIRAKKGYDWNKLEKLNRHKELTQEVRKRLQNEKQKLEHKLAVVDKLLAKPLRVKRGAADERKKS